MNESESYQIEKLIPHKTKPKGTAYIRDDDLQIHIPNVRDAPQLDAASNFKSIYSHFLNESGKIQASDMQTQANQGTELKLAMEEMQTTFDSMMQIREKLNQAYQEFMQMQ